MAIINGTPLNDKLVGLNQTGDEIYGLAGNDTINGLGGGDFIYGGDGRDVLYGNDGGADNDMVSYAGASAGVRVNLSLTGQQDTRGAGRDTIFNVEYITGSDFNDVLSGDAGNNYMTAGNGRDTLNGGAGGDQLRAGFDLVGDTLNGGDGHDNLVEYGGADRLSGGTGNDVLRGGLADDILTGGTGIDRFYFSFQDLGAGVSREQITDFEIGIDKIVVGSSDTMVLSVSGIASAKTVLLDYNFDGVADMSILVKANGILSATDFQASLLGGGILLP